MFKKATLTAAALAVVFATIQPMAGANAEPLIINPELLKAEPVLTPELVATPTLVNPELVKIPDNLLLLKPISCKAARKLVKNAGYHKVKTIECGAPVYTFKAKKNGHKTAVTVNAYTKVVSAI